MRYIGVIPKDLATGLLWPQIESLIGQAMPYGRGEFTLEDIKVLAHAQRVPLLAKDALRH